MGTITNRKIKAWELLELLIEDVSTLSELKLNESDLKVDTKGQPKHIQMFFLDDSNPKKQEWLKDCKEKNINPDTGKKWRSEASKNYKGGKGPKFKTLSDNKKPLTEEERTKVMKEKATWHHGKNGEATPAIWKSEVNGKTWYVTNTHRAYNVCDNLDLAIDRYHDFIKGTA